MGMEPSLDWRKEGKPKEGKEKLCLMVSLRTDLRRLATGVWSCSIKTIKKKTSTSTVKLQVLVFFFYYRQTSTQ